METRFDGSLVNDGINNNTYELLFKDYFNLSEEECGSIKDALTFIALDSFTKNERENKLVKFNDFLNGEFIIDVSKISYDEEKNSYIYNDEDYSIPFNLISRLFNGFGFKEELLSDKRYGQCHLKIINISPYVPYSTVVTGYITIGPIKALHTILEFENETDTVVYDWTRNLEMRKEDYYRMTKFEEVARFDGFHPREDMKYLEELQIGCKPYVTFRDEIMRDIEKNKSLFKK